MTAGGDFDDLLYAVFDGHSGSHTAEFAKANLVGGSVGCVVHDLMICVSGSRSSAGKKLSDESAAQLARR